LRDEGDTPSSTKSPLNTADLRGVTLSYQ